MTRKETPAMNHPRTNSIEATITKINQQLSKLPHVENKDLISYEIVFEDGSKATVEYPPFEEIEKEWNEIAPILESLGLFEILPLEEEE